MPLFSFEMVTSFPYICVSVTFIHRLDLDMVSDFIGYVCACVCVCVCSLAKAY